MPPDTRYAVPTWNAPESRGTAAAMAEVWDVDLDPVSKLLLIGYADSPRSIVSAAQWAGLSFTAARSLTDTLLGAGLVEEYVG